MSFVSKRGSGGNLFTYIYLVSVCVYLEIVSVCHFIYIETSLNQTLNKPESCINRKFNKVPMYEIFVNLTCIKQIPVYSEHISWSQGGSLMTSFTVFNLILFSWFSYNAVINKFCTTVKLSYLLTPLSCRSKS